MNRKQRVFVEEYLACWNGAEAARRAGYSHSDRQGSRLLRNVEVQEEIKNRLIEKTLSADEVLVRLAEQARGEGAKYLDKYGSLNLDLLIADNKEHLIKAIKQTKYGLNIEFYDAQSALVQIGRHLGLFQDKLDVNAQSDGELRVRFVGKQDA